MVGLYTAQSALTPAFGDRVRPTTYLIALRRGVDPVTTAKRLEAAFLANGLQADAVSKLLHDAVSASLTFDRLIEAFMALGLLVGVTALGVISARAVVERRQQIGVLRAIGFRKGMVQLSFLLESSFIALTAIAVGTGLGLAVAFNVVDEYARQPSMENLSPERPLADARHHLPRRLRGRAADRPRTRPPRLPHLPRRSPALPVTGLPPVGRKTAP